MENIITTLNNDIIPHPIFLILATSMITTIASNINNSFQSKKNRKKQDEINEKSLLVTIQKNDFYDEEEFDAYDMYITSESEKTWNDVNVEIPIIEESFKMISLGRNDINYYSLRIPSDIKIEDVEFNITGSGLMENERMRIKFKIEPKIYEHEDKNPLRSAKPKHPLSEIASFKEIHKYRDITHELSSIKSKLNSESEIKYNNWLTKEIQEVALEKEWGKSELTEFLNKFGFSYADYIMGFEYRERHQEEFINMITELGLDYLFKSNKDNDGFNFRIWL